MELNEKLKKALIEKSNNLNKGYNTIVSLLNDGANFKIINKETLEEISNEEISKSKISAEVNKLILEKIRSYLKIKETSPAVKSSNEVETSAINELTLIDIINIIRMDKKNYQLSSQQWNAMLNCLESTDNLFHWERKLRNSSDCSQEFKKVLIEFNNKDLSDKKRVLDSLLINAIKTTKPDIVELLVKNGANIEPENILQLALRKKAKKQEKILEILNILTSKMNKSEDQFSKLVSGLLNKAIELNQPHILDFIFDTSYMKNLVTRQQLEYTLAKNENELKTKMHARNTLSPDENRHNLDSDIEELESEQMMLIEKWLECVQFKKLVEKIEEETEIEKLDNIKKCLEYYEKIYEKSGHECLKNRLKNLIENIEAKKSFLLKRSAAINSEEMDIDHLTRGIKRLGSSSLIRSRSKSPRMFQQSQPITPSQNDEGSMEINYTPSP